MKNLKMSAAAPWIIGTVSLLASAGASAASYAVSYDSITNFSLGLPTGASFGGFTFSTDAAVSIGDLTGGDVNLSFQDAPAACIGTYCSGFNNSFASHGISPWPGYSYGDAQIGSADVLGDIGAASSIGEATAYDGYAIAAGANVMKAKFTLQTDGQLDFSFLATPYMKTQLGAGALSATGGIGMSIAILPWGGNNATFQWTPDGQAGGIVGGTESQDPFSLNLGINGNTIYSHGPGSFSASTATLAAGTYVMNIQMNNTANVAAVAVVPVPAALPLFGSGIAVLAVLAKRRKRNQA